VRMQAVHEIVAALKEQGVNFVVSLPDVPDSILIRTLTQDPAFKTVIVTNEGEGVALAAGSWLGGKKPTVIINSAGLLVATWSLANTGMFYGIPLLLLCPYRGDIGDRSRVRGGYLRIFKLTVEPLLQTLQIPHRVVARIEDLRDAIRDAQHTAATTEIPVALLLTGEVLW